jgi:hypothetical protein
MLNELILEAFSKARKLGFVLDKILYNGEEFYAIDSFLTDKKEEKKEDLILIVFSHPYKRDLIIWKRANSYEWDIIYGGKTMKTNRLKDFESKLILP